MMNGSGKSFYRVYPLHLLSKTKFTYMHRHIRLWEIITRKTRYFTTFIILFFYYYLIPKIVKLALSWSYLISMPSFKYINRLISEENIGWRNFYTFCPTSSSWAATCGIARHGRSFSFIYWAWNRTSQKSNIPFSLLTRFAFLSNDKNVSRKSMN